MNAHSFVGAIVLPVVLFGADRAALAGVEPCPFHVLVANRTNVLDPASPFANKSMWGMVVTLRVDLSNVQNSSTGIVDVPVSLAGTLQPGQVLSLPVLTSYAGTQGAQLISWSFSAVAGIEPSPFRTVFAYETIDAAQADTAPLFPAAYASNEMPILGFASPGVVLGAVAMVADDLIDRLCPAVPQSGAAWRNHGQYVRCVAQQADLLVLTGMMTTEQADAIVAAAAQSEVGK